MTMWGNEQPLQSKRPLLGGRRTQGEQVDLTREEAQTSRYHGVGCGKSGNSTKPKHSLESYMDSFNWNQNLVISQKQHSSGYKCCHNHNKHF